MKNESEWRPSKYVQRGKALTASRDVEEAALSMRRCEVTESVGTAGTSDATR